MDKKNEYPLFVVNAFTKGPFSGNPAAVCLVKKTQEPSDQLKQKLATELHLSETAYVTTISEEDDFSTASRFGLRWFTPTTEIILCGHATLASSTVLFNSLSNINQAITFDTLSGALIVRKTADGKFSMDFPSNEPHIQDEEELKGVKNLIKNHTPPFNLLHQAHGGQKILGVIVTLKGSSDNGCTSEDGTVYDFVSRVFVPWYGIDEDPVTGAAHTILAPYWGNILGKKKLFACQCSKRSGQLWLDIGTKGRVEIVGDAFTFIKGNACIQ